MQRKPKPAGEASRPLPKSLVELAARIDKMAAEEAAEIYQRMAGSLNGIISRTGATVELLQEVAESLKEGMPEPGGNQVIVDFARQAIINRLVNEKEKSQ